MSLNKSICNKLLGKTKILRLKMCKDLGREKVRNFNRTHYKTYLYKTYNTTLSIFKLDRVLYKWNKCYGKKVVIFIWCMLIIRFLIKLRILIFLIKNVSWSLWSILCKRVNSKINPTHPCPKETQSSEKCSKP